VNPALCVMLGCSRDDLIGMLPSRPPAEGTEKAFESVLYRRDGSRVDVLLHEAPLLDGSGHQAGWMASILDISEQKRNAEVVRQQNDRMHRMSRVMTMGEMASALAHELNQPLTALTSYLSAALNVLQASPRGATPEETFGTLVKAKQQADRAGAIIRRVRQFVRKSGPVLVEIDLNELLSDVLPLVKLQTGDLGEEVALRVDRHLPPVVGDRVLLEQVLLNLTKNAFEAMMHLDVTQRRIVIFIETDAADPSIVVVGVRDHGGGLPDGGAHILTSTLSTTKPDGMGMGLAICRTALEFMGSRLVYTQADGGGADFRFSLPVASFHAS